MRKFRLVLSTVLMTAAMSFTAFAGSWQSDSTGWWYQNDDGSYPVSSWQWIDGDGNGTAECYYFNEKGYCLMNTTTPDNCSVNADGAWTVDGIVQTQNTSTIPAQANSDSTSIGGTIQQDVANEKMVWISATGSKYHTIPDCGKMNPDKASHIPLSDALARNLEPCSKCY